MCNRKKQPLAYHADASSKAAFRDSGHFNGCQEVLTLVLTVLLFAIIAPAGAAPPPVLQTPIQAATNVDPDGSFTWSWTDELILNGSFESGLDSGWYTGGDHPEFWSIYTLTTNTYRMGYRFAGSEFSSPILSGAGQLIQDIYIPSDASSATLRWSSRIENMIGTAAVYPARLRVMLCQGGTPIAMLEDAYRRDPGEYYGSFQKHSTNLLAFAGQYFQLVVQAELLQPIAIMRWYADVDGFSLSCQHPEMPEFQILLGKSFYLRATNQIGSTTSLSFSPPPLEPMTTYFWQVGSVRDGRTNFSSMFQFRTGQRVLPVLRHAATTPTGVQLSFNSKTNRSYTVQQRDSLEPEHDWYDVSWPGRGTGTAMMVEVPFPWSDQSYWRIRVDAE